MIVREKRVTTDDPEQHPTPSERSRIQTKSRFRREGFQLKHGLNSETIMARLLFLRLTKDG